MPTTLQMVTDVDDKGHFLGIEVELKMKVVLGKAKHFQWDIASKNNSYESRENLLIVARVKPWRPSFPQSSTNNLGLVYKDDGGMKIVVNHTASQPHSTVG